jgi:hypothetical protein
MKRGARKIDCHLQRERRRGRRSAYVFAHEAEAELPVTSVTIYWLHLSRLSDSRKLLQHHNIREGDV